MRLVTYRDTEGIRLGALRDETVVALDKVAPDMLALIGMGAAGLERAAAAVARAERVQAISAVQFLAPIPRPLQNVICVGLNYVAHAIEAARADGREQILPKHPVFFTKAVTAVCGPNSEFPLDPLVTQALDYEVELAFILGRTSSNIRSEEALQFVFGYTILNDISARDLQSLHQQFFKGKSLDFSCPVGPCIVTTDEIPDPSVLQISLRVNGELRQHSTTGDLIFDIPTLIEALSVGMTLEASTIVSTGTPSGVGLGRRPPSFLKSGDVVEAAIERIGVLRTRIVNIS
jgi:2-keto-4-pentenoate hydratase/2-oxohepta-3-ene-1,7-dioic acid hydratase in catechol pathway